MSQPSSTTVRLKVSPQVAKIIAPGAPRDAKLSAARGALPLSGKDLLTCLLSCCNSPDAEIKQAAVKTLKTLPESILQPVLNDAELHPQLIELVVRGRMADDDLMGAVIVHPNVQKGTLLYLAQKGSLSVLERLAGNHSCLEAFPEIVEAIIVNPNADRALKFRLGWQDPDAVETEESGETSSEDDSTEEADLDDEELSDEDIEALLEEAEEGDRSKVQIAMDLKVSEKIKIGITGDKEWRAILIKDSNKLVQGAVMKNPRITEGEVLFVAKSVTASDELIRLILLNKDWMKLYEMKKAMIYHPKTPPPQAMRMVQYMNIKDLKDLARSRNVSTLVKMTAFKDLERRLKRGG
jgi:hypothetical protein